MKIPQIGTFQLQIVILIHFILTVWANQCQWLPDSYMFCNFLVLAVGVAALLASSDNSVSELWLSGMAFALLHDIIIIAVTYDGDETRRLCKKIEHFRFSFGMSILSAILKPVAFIVILLNYIARGDGGLKQKVKMFRANRGASTETRNEEPSPYPPSSYPPTSYPPGEAMPYGNQAY